MRNLDRRTILILVGAGALFGSIRCFAQEIVTFERSPLYIITESGKHEFEVEMALTDRQQTQGLMFRRSLPRNAGMLFDYRMARSINMWMKNTYIPLDIIFIGNDGKIVNIAQRTIPHSEAMITSRGKARAVLEVNGGTVSRLGIIPGDKVEHPIFKK